MQLMHDEFEEFEENKQAASCGVSFFCMVAQYLSDMLNTWMTFMHVKPTAEI